MNETSNTPILNTHGKEIRVAKVLDAHKLVLNIGSNNNVTIGLRFLIYGLSDDEILDPATGDSLGYLELVRGTGIVIYMQEKMCVVESDSTRTNLLRVLDGPETVPFEYPLEGDFAREIQ